MQKSLIFLITSVAVILTLGGTTLVYADVTKIDQDYPNFKHGIVIIYEMDRESNQTVPTQATLTGGPSPYDDYTLSYKETYENGTKVYVSDFIKTVVFPSNPNRYQIEKDVSHLTAIVNGISSNETDVVSTEQLNYLDLLELGYSGLYEIGLELHCNDSEEYQGDTDGDGLCDAWEDRLEVFDAEDQSVVYEFDCDPAIDYGADPLGTHVCPNKDVPDLFFEIDSMSGHRPNQFALEQLVSIFSNTPYDVNGEVTGINAHFQISDGNLPHVDALPMPGGGVLAGYDALKKVWFGTSTDRGFTHPPDPSNYWNVEGIPGSVRDLKSQVYHYIILGHKLYGSDIDTTGAAELPGNDALITLGGWDFKVGNEGHQAGTIMHEIGHNLNLHHGGLDSVNCKPNYFSVMSYSRQFPDLIVGLAPGFSDNREDSFDAETNFTVPPNEVTVYGMASGSSYENATAGETVVGSTDVNHINDVSCDGVGDNYLSNDDLVGLAIMNRTFGTFDEGRGIEETDMVSATPAEERGNIPDLGDLLDQATKARPCNVRVEGPVTPGSDLSHDRTCVTEKLLYQDVIKIRELPADNFNLELTNYNAELARNGCIDEVRTLLGQISSYTHFSAADVAGLDIEALEDLRDDRWVDATDNIDTLINLLNSTQENDGRVCIADDGDRAHVVSLAQSNFDVISRAVPEFETMAIIILSISIISIVALTKNSKLSLTRINT